MPLNTIAHRIGFMDGSRLEKFFKRHQFITLGEFRKQTQNDVTRPPITPTANENQKSLLWGKRKGTRPKMVDRSVSDMAENF